MRPILELLCNHLELHEHLAANGPVGLDNAHRPSRVITFDLADILHQHRGLTKSIGCIDEHDPGLAALDNQLIHQPIAANHIAPAHRHYFEVARITQILYHARSSTRPHGYRNRTTTPATL